jgi:hypothetical protein
MGAKGFVALMQHKKIFLARLHHAFDLVFEKQSRTRFWRLTGAYMREQGFIVKHTLDQDFDPAATLLVAKKACRNNTGIIEYQ